MKKFKIAWFNRLTKKRGENDTPLDEELCEKYCKHLNNEFPDIRHWPEPVKKGDQS